MTPLPPCPSIWTSGMEVVPFPWFWPCYSPQSPWWSWRGQHWGPASPPAALTGQSDCWPPAAVNVSSPHHIHTASAQGTPDHQIKIRKHNIDPGFWRQRTAQINIQPKSSKRQSEDKKLNWSSFAGFVIFFLPFCCYLLLRLWPAGYFQTVF